MLLDEVDYVKASREDLVARLMNAQALSSFQFRAYDALQSHGVNYKDLAEWKDMEPLTMASKLRPHQGGPLVIQWLERLEHALTAAVRRKRFTLV